MSIAAARARCSSQPLSRPLPWPRAHPPRRYDDDTVIVKFATGTPGGPRRAAALDVPGVGPDAGHDRRRRRERRPRVLGATRRVARRLEPQPDVAYAEPNFELQHAAPRRTTRSSSTSTACTTRARRAAPRTPTSTPPRAGTRPGWRVPEHRRRARRHHRHRLRPHASATSPASCRLRDVLHGGHRDRQRRLRRRQRPRHARGGHDHREHEQRRSAWPASRFNSSLVDLQGARHGGGQSASRATSPTA